MRPCEAAVALNNGGNSDGRNMNEDWIAVIVGLSLVGLVIVRLIGSVPW